VISEIKEELRKRLKESVLTRLKNTFSGSIDELFEGLDDLVEEAESDRFISVLGLKTIASKSKEVATRATESHLAAGVSAGPATSASFSAGKKSSAQILSNNEAQFADVLMRVFQIKEFIGRLKSVLNTVGIRHLFVFIDDFSELPQDAMRVVVDTILAPLNNWSDELIKFKVAAYPARVYYGDIDKTKIDEIYLDLYYLYGTTDVSGMEEKAIDFTRRLLHSRLQYYCGADYAKFFDATDDEFWRLLFYATTANPRNLGHILYYLHESHLIYERSIGNRAVRDAAQRYYEEKIAPYFKMNRFLHESFEERSSVYSLKELLEAIVGRARDLKRHRDSAVMRDLRGTPPTSHFHIPLAFEALLSTLELNFFVTKYYEMSDRDGKRVAVYALNFGLCEKYTIAYGRPTEKREHRLYFVERIFDYTPIFRRFIQNNQEIRCDSCGETVEFDKLEALKLYGMKCPKCNIGTCQVTNLSRKYAQLLNSVAPELLLPNTEFGILQILSTERRSMYPAEIAAELDRSYQLVGKRGKILAERGLVDRNENEQGRRQFELTPLAEKSYFNESDDTILELPPPGTV
jgi:predicted transcriptional regulator